MPSKMYKERVQGGNGVRNDQERDDRMNLLCVRVCERTRRRRHLINLLVTIFGIGACIGVNGIVAELPLLVKSAPEGSALSANVAIAFSIAFLPPAIYALSNRSTARLKNSREVLWISSVLIFGTAAMVLLAFFHDVTTTINSSSYSSVLTFLSFMSATNAALRNILLMPYLRNFEEVNLASFFIGEGLSGFLPSTVALFQGVGDDPICPVNTTNSTDSPEPQILPPKFPPRDFFLFLSSLLAASTISFRLLEYLRVRSYTDNEKASFDVSSKKLLGNKSAEKIIGIEMTDVSDRKASNPVPATKNELSNCERTYLCTLMYIVCTIGTGYLSSMETFSSRPYGNDAYHLVVNLCQLSATAACVLAYWLPPLSIRGVTVMTGLACTALTYDTWLALCSPMPPWRGTTHGVVLLVIVWILSMGIVSYTKLAITEIIWQDTSNDAGLYQLGFVLLFGTISGSVTAFVCINFTTVFTPYTPCRAL